MSRSCCCWFVTDRLQRLGFTEVELSSRQFLKLFQERNWRSSRGEPWQQVSPEVRGRHGLSPSAPGRRARPRARFERLCWLVVTLKLKTWGNLATQLLQQQSRAHLYRQGRVPWEQWPAVFRGFIFFKIFYWFNLNFLLHSPVRESHSAKQK